jgi:phosphoribosyl 1,2-cyclic phosphodiesterase
MRFAWLGSGSRGNAALVQAAGTTVMLDCGLSLADTEARLGRLGVAPSGIAAILVTHEHGDHAGGVARFARRYGVTVMATSGTTRGLRGPLPKVERISAHEAFMVGDLELRPMPVPHDAREPCQFVFSDGAALLGILTDLGRVTAHVIASINGCDALALECNHDAGMLADGPYTPALKRRVGGAFGHLSNAQAAGLLAELDTSRLKHLVAVHLSEINNTPSLARASLAAGLGCAPADISVAHQDDGLGWRQI